MSVEKPIPVVLVATGNAGKFREIADAFADAPVRLICLNDLPATDPSPEDGKTFRENAEQKARYYSRAFGLMTLAENSGLEVDVLNGAPGVFSARYAGSAADDSANNAKLVKELAGVPLEKRTARFRCAMALVDPTGQILATTEGSIEGLIIDRPRGTGGFGYDPHFLVPELGKTTAEISRQEKNAVSHRGQAARAMKTFIR